MTEPLLFEELILSDARGGRKAAAPVRIEVARAMTEADLEGLADAPPAAQVPLISSIRHAHHQLARQVAIGTKGTEISLITGYSPAYISAIKNDPAFKELVAYYTSQREAMFVDTLERMKSLGLSTLDELQRRLAETPEGWSNRELMEMSKLMLIDTNGVRTGASGGGAAATSISISFVTPAPQGEAPAGTFGMTIDGERS